MRLAPAALLATASIVHAQTVIYVDDDAPRGGDGSSWESAFDDLHEALGLASFTLHSIEIRVGQGLYLPDLGTGDTALRYEIHSAAAVCIRGAFAGLGAAEPDEQDFVKYITRLSADLMQNDDGTHESRMDNADTILYWRGMGGGSRIEGLRFDGAVGEETSTAALSARASYGVVADCVFVDNITPSDAGAVLVRNGHPTFERCRFENNSAGSLGGALRSRNGAVDLEDCVFIGNSAAKGAAVHAQRGDPDIRRCRFINNVATTGACYFVDFDLTPSYRVISSVFFGNIGSTHGVAVYSDALTELHGCTFAMNQGEQSKVRPVERADGAVIGSGNLFWENGLTPNGAYTYTIGGGGGEGNSNADPMFIDMPTGDLRLSPYSPAIDAGSNNGVYTMLDAAGQPRRSDDPAVADTGFGDAPIVDMGAYEFQGSSCAADFNADGELNVLDFIDFQIAFTANDPAADCNADDAFTILDFVCFQQAFVAGCP